MIVWTVRRVKKMLDESFAMDIKVHTYIIQRSVRLCLYCRLCICVLSYYRFSFENVFGRTEICYWYSWTIQIYQREKEAIIYRKLCSFSYIIMGLCGVISILFSFNNLRNFYQLYTHASYKKCEHFTKNFII